MHRLLRLSLLAPAVLLSACQVLSPKPAPAPRLPNNASGVSVAGVATGPSTSNTALSTYTIKRDTLTDSLALSGKVVPQRSAQLVFHGSGTVAEVSVTPGQPVQQGDELAQFALDDASLQASRAQATLANLAYQSEQARLDELQAGASGDSIQQLTVTIEKDRADVEKLTLEKAAAQTANDQADQARTAAQAAADRKVALAQAALKAANDNVTTAQANVKRAQDDAHAAQDQASGEADSAATAATAAVRIAQRQVDAATEKVGEAQSGPNAAGVAQQIETQQLRVDQDKEAIAEGKSGVDWTSAQTATVEHNQRQISGEVAQASAALHAAQRALATDSLELKHLQTGFQGAKAADASALKAANFGLQDAKDQLAALKLAEQQAQQKAQSLTRQAAANTPSRASQQTIATAQAAVQQALAAVDTAQLNLEDAQAAQGAEAAHTQTQFAEHSLTAATAQLNADQARLAVQQRGTSTSEIARELTKVNILKDQADIAAAAAQPVVALKAPFDGTVVEVGISAGQALASGGQPLGAAALDGQSGASQLPVIRVVGTGANSVVADAGESDVAQLSRGQTVDVNFPGLPGQTTSGTIVDIAPTATVKDNQVTYPVRIELPVLPPTVRFGMTAQASINLAQARDVLVAPRRAIRTTGGQSLVSRLDSNGQIQDVPVDVGRTFGTSVELLGGVQPGDVVVVPEATTTAATRQPSN